MTVIVRSQEDALRFSVTNSACPMNSTPPPWASARLPGTEAVERTDLLSNPPPAVGLGQAPLLNRTLPVKKQASALRAIRQGGGGGSRGWVGVLVRLCPHSGP